MSAASLIERFRNSARHSPDAVALVFPATKNPAEEKITYSVLAERVAQLASHLSSKGLKEGHRVAFIFPKSIDAVIVMLATLSCKATYVPIDAELPADRVKLILREADPHCLINHPDHFPSESPCQQDQMSSKLDLINACVTFLPAEDESNYKDLDAILYTSGSTGTPKGVCLSEKNISAFVDWALETFDVSNTDIFSSIAPFNFDLSLFDLYVAFCVGATIVLYDSSFTRNPKSLAASIAKNKISVLYATPSQLNVLYHFGKISSEDLSSLWLVLFAGEVYPAQQLHLWMKAFPHISFWNLYGPTETNVCTCFPVPKTFDETRIDPYPIGKVCKHLEGRISSEGELLIAGDNVMEGYRDHEEKNDVAFMEIEGKKYYRTGDRVEEDVNGDLVYAGRLDRMIKKRGYRIEPAEVEATLSDLESVVECAVTSEKTPDGFTQLVAFLVMNDPEQESVMTIKHFCAEKLPLYMIPDRFVFLKELPKTSSGKIDVSVLAKSD
ncbi:MAG TPA: amino acid adenylation domain-containing protein [Bacteroidia bacterium]|nr:amino acid adenylation domain-containing protein [Bacteroidia bacterium]